MNPISEPQDIASVVGDIGSKEHNHLGEIAYGGLRARNMLKQGQGEKPLISLITVVYNGVATIEHAIRSVIEQNYDNIEYIVIDGGSTDGTVDILRHYDVHLDYWRSEPDDGIYDAMNKGIALASGDVVGFLNADDLFANETVLEQVAAAFRDATLDACFADMVYVSRDNRKVRRYWKSRPFSPGDFAAGWCPAHPTFYVRKSVLDRYGSFDKSFKLAADVELMMRLLERNRIRTAYFPRVWVRMRVGGQTNQSWKNILVQNKEIMLALEKNGLRFSRIGFMANKIVNRLAQFAAGHVRGGR